MPTERAADSADTADDRTSGLRATLVRHALDRLPSAGEYASAFPGLNLYRFDKPGEPQSALYQPSLSFVLQGGKRAILGGQTLDYNLDQYLLTAVDQPTFSHVVQASPEVPFLCLMLSLDLDVARSIVLETDVGRPAAPGSHPSMTIGRVTVDLLDVLLRVIALDGRPEDLRFMAPLLVREVTYRLLTGAAGAWLRQVAVRGTPDNRLTEVITWLRHHYAQSVRVEELAEMAAMAVSTFHHHFRALTRMSPHQYQKLIRLHEARKLLMLESVDAVTVAMRVGYESATQFNREYRRLFGNPPIRDVTGLREAADI